MTKAVLLILWGALVISTIDNFLRPRLIKNQTKLHELFIFFSVLGGISLFGLLGIVMGPVVLAITLGLLSTFKEDRTEDLKIVGTQELTLKADPLSKRKVCHASRQGSMRRIAVLTSGGDTAGMNAAIRAVVRTGLDNGWEVYGVRAGYGGLIAGDFRCLGARDVGGIIQLGGTMLRSGRCLEFKVEAGRNQALRNLRQNEIEALVVIGGDGSQTGAYLLSQTGFPVVGIASTIDNDLYGSEITIGVDTALNVALESIDRLKVTASSHRRAFLVEVMGRNCGYLALIAGITGGAEVIVIPEVETSPEDSGDRVTCCLRARKGARYCCSCRRSPVQCSSLIGLFPGA